MEAIVRHLILFVAFVSVSSAACSNTPTSPTSNVAIDPATLSTQLRWDVTASSCAPSPMTFPAPKSAPAAVQPQSDGSIIASWPYTNAGRDVMLYANFIRSTNGEWTICSWDTADI
jgi:hypothetical protein